MFDVGSSGSKQSVKCIYKISFFENVYNICAWLWSRCGCSSTQWHQPQTFLLDRNLFIPSTSDHFYYEFTYWNGKKKLVRTEGTFIPNVQYDVNSIGAKREKKILYVSMCGHDVTDFVNQYVSSLTKENNIIANDLFAIAVLSSQIPTWSWKDLHLHFNNSNNNNNMQKDDVIETEFVMCDEIIEKSRFKGCDVVYFNG
jgi:hypothetical protein